MKYRTDPAPLQPVQPPRPPSGLRPKADADGPAIAGFIMAFIIPVAGFILGAVSQNQAKRRGLRQSGLATAAMVLGAAFTVIEVLAVIVIIAAAHKTGGYDACINNEINTGYFSPGACTP